ncbi:ArsA family ATPase, partial [Streptomyces sp. NPDC127574]
YGSSDSTASETAAPDEGSPDAPRRTAATDSTPDTDGTAATDPERSVDQLTAGLLRLHAERMQLLSREQRTRDRFTARHPEVAVAEVAALPGDVHDLAGLRDIGNRLAAHKPELPES